MKTMFSILTTLVLLSGAQAMAADLSTQLACSGGGESFTLTLSADKQTVSEGSSAFGSSTFTRDTQDPDCAYRSTRFACYEDGQVMVNIPFALAAGAVKSGTVYVQSDTGDNADSHNHALLGAAYTCTAQ